MKITLFVPCFVDAFYPKTAMQMVELFEELGHEVNYKPELTCCGQPAFNAGFWDESRKVSARVLDALKDAEVVVIASGSCGAMLKVFTPEIWKDTPRYEEAQALSAKTYEFAQFLVDVLGVTDLGAKFPHRITYHDGCHGLRELGIHDAPRKLMANVEGLELVEMDEAATCCGFGGLFSVKHAPIATAMGQVKCASAEKTGAQFLVSCDGSCLMHVQGLLDRQKSDLKSLHLVEILRSK